MEFLHQAKPLGRFCALAGVAGERSLRSSQRGRLCEAFGSGLAAGCLRALAELETAVRCRCIPRRGAGHRSGCSCVAGQGHSWLGTVEFAASEHGLKRRDRWSGRRGKARPSAWLACVASDPASRATLHALSETVRRMGGNLEARRGYRLLETFEDRRGGTRLGGQLAWRDRRPGATGPCGNGDAEGCARTGCGLAGAHPATAPDAASRKRRRCCACRTAVRRTSRSGGKRGVEGRLL